MSIQENTLVFRRSLLHLVVIGSIIHQSISFLSRGHSTPLCPALPCVTLLREALVYFYLQKSVPIQPKTSNILPKFCQPTLRPRVCDEVGPAACPARPRRSPQAGYLSAMGSALGELGRRRTANSTLARAVRILGD